MLHLFFSYSRHDSALVYDVAKRVEESVGHVWIDKEDIPSSVPWRDEIEAAIESAALVVVFDSPSWRQSEICQSEAEIAHDSAKAILVVTTDSPVDAVCQQIADAQTQLTIGDLRNAEVLTRTRAWNQSGRKRSLLATRMQLRGLRKALRDRPVPLSEPVTAFLSASRRIAIVRGILSALAIVATIALISSFRILEGVNERVSAEIATKSESHASENQMELLAAYAPVELLEMLAQDDTKTISAELRLLQLTSQKWPIERWGPNGTLPVGAETATGPLGTASIVADGTVTIEDDNGVLQRMLTHGSPAISLAWSPHGTLLAVARPQHIDVINPTTGLTVATLHASLPDVAAVTWESTSGKLTVLTSKGAGMRWDLASLSESALGADAWTISGAGFPESDSMLVSLRGRLTVLDGAGLVTASRTTEDFYVNVTATDMFGVMAAFRIRNGEPPHLVLIDEDAAETEAFTLSDECLPGGIAVTALVKFLRQFD